VLYGTNAEMCQDETLRLLRWRKGTRISSVPVTKQHEEWMNMNENEWRSLQSAEDFDQMVVILTLGLQTLLRAIRSKPSLWGTKICLDLCYVTSRRFQEASWVTTLTCILTLVCSVFGYFVYFVDILAWDQSMHIISG
jgi:hypothetical protein